jgi:hypothetical protein
MKIHIIAVNILLFDISYTCTNPDWLSIISFLKSKPKTWGGQFYYGGSRSSYYIASFPGAGYYVGKLLYNTVNYSSDLINEKVI